MPASGDDVFQRVLRDFKDCLKPEEREQFRMTSLSDLQQAIAGIQRRQRSSRTMQNMTRLRAFLEAMEAYSKVLDIFVNVNEFVAFVWGPIKFLLQVASTFAEAFNALLDAYQRISETLPALVDFQAMFSDNIVMRKALEMMFGDIFEFHRQALRHFRGSVWKQLFSATWKTFDTRFRDILESMRHHKDLIETRASIIEYKKARDARLLAEKQFAALEENELIRRRERLYAWLSPINVLCDQEQWKSVRDYNQSAGQWILKKSLVRDWIESPYPNSPMLWINGIPGAGKTVLASLLVEEASKNTAATVIYFFCRNNDSQRNNFVAMCRSLIHQLLAQHDSLATFLFDAASSPNSDTALRTQKLAGDLLSTCLKAVGNVYIIIDGLDECPSLEQKHIAENLRKFIDGTASEKEPCRCLFLSQDDGAIRKLLCKMPSIRIVFGDNRHDIQAFSQHWAHKIQVRFGEAPANMIREIVGMVTEGSQGMFLFAKLVMENLHEQNSLRQLKNELQPGVFPQGLQQAYDRIIDRILYQATPAKQRDAKRLLALIVYAIRPLKWREIQIAVCLDSDNQQVDFERRLVDNAKDLCGSIVEEGQDEEIVLVHSTARSYLEDQKLVQPSEDNLDMAELSVEYLTYPIFDHDVPNSDIDCGIINGSYGFAEYASVNWTKHMENALRPTRHHELDRLSTFEETIGAYFDSHWKDPSLRSTVPRRAAEIAKSLRRSELHTQVLETIAAMDAASAPDVFDIIPLMTTDVFSTLFRIRDRLEVLAENRTDREKLALHYGKPFKCPRLHCKWFYNGFRSRRERDDHKQKHERPYLCPHADCAVASVGCTSKAELERHIADYHPSEPTEKEFPSKKRENRASNHEQANIGQKRPGSFICETCGQSFSKASNERAHQKVHAQKRPKFACEHCDRTFAYPTDRTRHMKSVHEKERELRCGDEPEIEGFKWGCGKSFARGDGLARHLQSEAGYACKQSMEEAQQQRSLLSQQDLEADTLAGPSIVLTDADSGIETSASVPIGTEDIDLDDETSDILSANIGTSSENLVPQSFDRHTQDIMVKKFLQFGATVHGESDEGVFNNDIRKLESFTHDDPAPVARPGWSEREYGSELLYLPQFSLPYDQSSVSGQADDIEFDAQEQAVVRMQRHGHLNESYARIEPNMTADGLSFGHPPAWQEDESL